MLRVLADCLQLCYIRYEVDTNDLDLMVVLNVDVPHFRDC